MPGSDGHTDADLLGRLREDSEAAFEEIFNRYWTPLYAAAYRVITDEDCCKDILQEIFVSLWERRAESGVNNLGAYLSRAVKFQTATYFRNNSLKDKHLRRIREITPSSILPHDEVDLTEIDKRIEALAMTLPTRCREIFYLSRVKHLTNAEIAARLNISIRTVETQISKSLRHIRPILKSFLLALLMDFVSKQ